MAEKLICTLDGRDGVKQCHPVKDCSECRRCGWELHEAERRRELLRTEGTRLDRQTMLHSLRVRREPERMTTSG